MNYLNKPTTLKKGDKLPGNLMSEEDWIMVRDMVDNEPNPTSIEFRAKIYPVLIKLKKKYCVGENEEKCLLCGSTGTEKIKVNPKGLCPACAKAFTGRGVLRQCGITRGFMNPQLTCICCEKEQGRTLGLCMKCYRLYKKKDGMTVEEFVAAEKELRQQKPIIDTDRRNRFSLDNA